MSKKKLIDAHYIFTAKKACPYCGSDLKCFFESWIQNDDSTWSGEYLQTECTSNPGFDSTKYDEWWAVHSKYPYIYWHPFTQKLEDYINKKYIFDL